MRTNGSSPRDRGLQIDVERGPVGCAAVMVRGDLDMSTGPALRATLGELIASGRTVITLDLSGVTFIDSSGHRSIRSAADLAESRGGEIRLGGSSLVVRRFLAVTTQVLSFAARTDAATRPGTNGGHERTLRAVGF